ncbi:TlpA family protein disulfide reductase [Olivibacter sitiensis]|uniref:TlpA family protein disulfide reductase n=1 Tax=Olivibacter sitiensis TaxID=376470 RepID=UPI0003FB6ED2|nr:TlpA disulfide reductase family protein [Olivibacter sitiensis]
MKLNFTFLALVFILKTTLSIAQTPPKPVVLIGKVMNATASTPKVFGINFLNPFLDIRKSATLNEDMAFSVQEEMVFTQNMTVSYNGKFINLYVVPGDTVCLTIDAAKLKLPHFEWLLITGDHAAISTQLNLCYDFMASLPNTKYDHDMGVGDMMEAVKQDYARQMLALDEYASQHDLDPLVLDFFRRDTKLAISNWISDYVSAENNVVSSKAERIQLFTDPFFEPFNDTNFVSMLFPYHVSNYTGWITREDSTIQQAIKEARLEEAIERGAKLILKEPAKGITRDYMLFSFISKLTNKHPELLTGTIPINEYFIHPLHYEYLVQAAEIANTTTFPATVIADLRYLSAQGEVTTVPTNEMLQFLAKQYPDKVLYVDVYATWCGPCLEEMKHAPAIHKLFAQDDVVFVNLCLQSSEANWEKLVQERQLQGEHYFLNADNSKLLMGNYNIGGFPTYMLIDKNGQIVTTEAPRPSDSENLKKAVEKLLARPGGTLTNEKAVFLHEK